MEITCARDAFVALFDLRHAEVEEFWVLALSSTRTLLNSKMIARGTVDSILTHPRDVFRFACLQNASSVMVAHNHPSGDTRPSENDLLFTNQLIRASRVIEIPLVDHLIVTPNRYSSFASEGWCAF